MIRFVHHSMAWMQARRLSALAATLCATALLAPGTAFALYKVVGPDGKVTYTDRPPVDQPSQAIKANGAVANSSSLPFELRQVAQRFPVTLYSATGCSLCDLGRRLLANRGIPYTEKLVDTDADLQALRRLENTDQVPVLRVGKQPLVGFSESDWSSYLDAAGYPKQSALPRNYVQGAAAPLVQASPPAPAANTRANAAAERAAAREAARAANGAPASQGGTPGFRF